MLAEGLELFIGNVIGVQGHSLGQTQRGLFGAGEIFAIRVVRQVLELFARPTEAEGDLSMGAKTVVAAIELRGADDDELLEARRKSAGVEDGLEVGDHGREDFRPMRHGAEHVRHTAAGAHKRS